VKLRLPDGVEAKRVRLLASGTEVEMRRDGRYVSVTVPLVRDYEVLAAEV
jgi:hypothetical protein